MVLGLALACAWSRSLAVSGHTDAVTGAMWCAPGVADDADVHVAFRGRFPTTAGSYSLRFLGASQDLVWLDGKLIADGPPRFPRAFPEYESVALELTAGEHTIAIHAHNDGVTSRILSAMPGFLWCQIYQGSGPVKIDWKCARIPGYRPRVHRISDILGWIDWFDSSVSWQNWEQPEFDDSSWSRPSPVDPAIGPIAAAQTLPVRLVSHSLTPIASGSLADDYGYESDDPAVRFFLRDLNPGGHSRARGLEALRPQSGEAWTPQVCFGRSSRLDRRNGPL